MKLASVEAIVRSLNTIGARYLIAGGLAVNAHGYIRLTMDVDLVIAMDPSNIARAFQAFAALGYKPIVPITAEQFANSDLRHQWIRDKGMTVLSFSSERHKETTLDVFVTVPFDFQRESLQALEGELSPGAKIRFVSLATLVAMKEAAGRPRDMDDLEHLRQILEERGSDE